MSRLINIAKRSFGRSLSLNMVATSKPLIRVAQPAFVLPIRHFSAVAEVIIILY
jgi:hypothetical protein